MINNHLVLVTGKSASGKSASLRNLDKPEGVIYLNCENGKKLPFKTTFKELTITDKWNSNKRAEEFEKFSSKLNSLGNEGWELISYQAIPLVGSWSKEVKGYAYLGMLKRALN